MNSTRSRVFAFGLFVLILFAITPASLSEPFFFSEEGGVYFKYAFENDAWTSLVAPQLGYYSLWANVATTVAAHTVPLEHAPLITTLFGLAVLLVIGVLVVMPGSPFDSTQRQVAALLVVLFMPTAYARTNTNYSMFYFGLCAAITLISAPPSRLTRWFHRATLLAAGLTGVLAVFLAPVFAWRAFRTRAKEAVVQTCILIPCGMLQLAIVVFDLSVPHGDGFDDARFGGFDWLTFDAALLNKSIVFNFLGFDAMQRCGQSLVEQIESGQSLWLWLALVLSSGLVGMLFLAKTDREQKQRTSLLLASFALLTVLTHIAITGGLGGKLQVVMGSHRYYYTPAVLVGFGLVLRALPNSAPNGRRARLFQVLLAWLLLVNVYGFVNSPMGNARHEQLERGVAWKASVAKWRADPGKPLIQRPGGWKFTLAGPKQ